MSFLDVDVVVVVMVRVPPAITSLRSTVTSAEILSGADMVVMMIDQTGRLLNTSNIN